MVLLISVYEREEEFQSIFLYLDWWSEQGSMCSLRGKRFRLITLSSLSPLRRRKATNVNISRCAGYAKLRHETAKF